MSIRKKLEEARLREERALQLWEQRNKEWDRAARGVAAKVGKPVSEVLHRTTHRWREKIEELDVVEASIPQHLKGGNSWEMGLREGAGGVRYVQFGTSFPYPLYCPVKNSDNVNPAHNTFMRVVHPAAATSGLAGGETIRAGEYYKSRYFEFRKNIAKRFPHRMHNPPAELLEVRGVPPPVSSEPVEERQDGAPVQHYEFEESLPDNCLASTPPTVAASAAEEAAAPEAEAPPGGPLLVLEGDRLLFHSEPGQGALSSLRVINQGTTAIFYSWNRIPPQPLRDTAGGELSRSTAEVFVLSDALTGVLLPGDEHYFTFAFRSPTPGIFTDAWELKTVPAGSGAVVISLRGVASAPEGDPISAAYLTDHLDARCTEEMMASFLLEMLNKGPAENVLDLSDHEAEGRRKEADARAAAAAAARDAEAARDRFTRANRSALRTDRDGKAKCRADFSSEAAWADADPGEVLFYHGLLYGQMQRLHRNAHALARAARGLPASEPPPWSGCAADLTDALQSIPLRGARTQMLLAHDALVGAARHGHRGDCGHPYQVQWSALLQEQQSVGALLAYSCMHRALSSVCEEMHERSIALQQHYGLIEAPVRGGAKGAKPPKAQPKGKPSRHEDELSAGELRQRCRAQLEEQISGALGDAVELALSLTEQQSANLSATTDSAPADAFAEEIAAQLQQHAESAAP
eukprot:TRINITY_DN1580_c0_g1_i1.p1 TRINITY_DN1580_c0_g1~~TRINITY_DN1580_c0_g1_i1.p1  ORF type:complete len:718 (+),score=235.27 TRINITY_DN1580_c0_g1_i1:84-2156(+)